MRKKVLAIFLFAIFFIGCNSSKNNSDNQITVVDGYISEATVTDANGVQASLVDSATGKYTFGNYSPIYPITAKGGKFYDTNVDFDITMSANEGTIISPISTIIGSNTSIKSNITTLLGLTNNSEIDVDYINSNNLDLTKLAQLCYAMIKDSDATNKFKTSLDTGFSTSSYSNVNALIDHAANNLAKNDTVKTFLESVKGFSGNASNIETELQTVKGAINLESIPKVTVPSATLTGVMSTANTYEFTANTINNTNAAGNGEFSITRDAISIENKSTNVSTNYDKLKTALTNNEYFNLNFTYTNGMTTTSSSTLVTSIIIDDGTNHIVLSMRTYHQRNILGKYTVETQQVATLAMSASLNNTDMDLTYAVDITTQYEGADAQLMSRYNSDTTTYQIFNLIDRFSDNSTYGDTIKSYMVDLLTKAGDYDIYLAITNFHNPAANKIQNTTTLSSVSAAVKNDLIAAINGTSGKTLADPSATTVVKINVTAQ